jgi:hypothetical protein
MSLSKTQIGRLNRIIVIAQKILETAQHEGNSYHNGVPRRRRRSAEDAAKMRQDILAKRAKGIPAAKLAEKYGVTTAYVYMIK